MTNTEKLIEQAQTVAQRAGVVLETGYENYLNKVGRLDYERIKKIWLKACLSSGEAVIIKFRPPNSIITSAEFRRTETVQAAVSLFLAQSGLPVQLTVNSDFDSELQWSVRQYFVGEPIGNNFIHPTIDTTGLFNYLLTLKNNLARLAEQIDTNLLNHPDWQQKWGSEFQQRRTAVVTTLGSVAADQLESAVNRPIRWADQETVIHNDLSPQNILQCDGQFQVIDWGEASLGPNSADWLTVWMFALDLPELRQRIFHQALEQAPSSAAKAEARDVFRALGARLVASFAEWSYHYSQNPTESERFGREAHEALPKAWQNYQGLSRQLEEE